MEKKHECVAERLIQHGAKLSTVLAMPKYYFFILHGCGGALTR